MHARYLILFLFPFVLFLLVLFLLPPVQAQVFTRLKPGETVLSPSDTIPQSPDADRSEIPFIDYLPGTVWMTPTDTVCDNLYIRLNYTDQMVSEWTHYRRLYPASRVYALQLGGKYYRTASPSPHNFVFAERVVKGRMNLYLYRIIPQFNGYVEWTSADPAQKGYTNNMIVERQETRGKWDQYGYFITDPADSSRMVPLKPDKMKEFAETWLLGNPKAYAAAMKFVDKGMQLTPRRGLGIGIMLASVAALLFVPGDVRWAFLLGLPIGAAIGQSDKTVLPEWQDLAGVVEKFNSE